MSDIINPSVCRLEAFDRHGVHCGSAWESGGRWFATTKGAEYEFPSAVAAEAWLLCKGANTVQPLREGWMR